MPVTKVSWQQQRPARGVPSAASAFSRHEHAQKQNGSHSVTQNFHTINHGRFVNVGLARNGLGVRTWTQGLEPECAFKGNVNQANWRNKLALSADKQTGEEMRWPGAYMRHTACGHAMPLPGVSRCLTRCDASTQVMTWYASSKSLARPR